MDGFESVGLRLDLLITGWGGLGLLVLGVVVVFAAFAVAGEFGVAFGALTALVGGLMLIFWLFLLIPFDTKYHNVYAVEGEVVSISNVLSESGGDLTRVPVVQLDSVDRAVTVDDPRIVTMQGESVSLICDIGWVFRGADRYECRIA